MVALVMPFTPTISSTSLEAVSLVQFLTNLVSALSFCMGVTAFAFFNDLKKLVETVVKTVKNPSKVEALTCQGIRTDWRFLNLLAHRVERLLRRNNR